VHKNHNLLVSCQNVSLSLISLSTNIIKDAIGKIKFRESIKREEESQQKDVNTLRSEEKRGIFKIDEKNDQKTYQEKC